MLILAIFLAALLFANVASVVKHRHTVWEMRRRHIMSLHIIEDSIKHYVDEKTLKRIQVHINQEVNKV